VALQGAPVHGGGPPEDGVNLVEVALDHADPGDALELGARGQVLVAVRPVVAAHADVLLAELLAKLVQVEDDGGPRAVLDQLAALAVEDVAPRPGDDDAPLVLEPLLLVVDRPLDDLLVGEARGEDGEEEGDQPVEGEEPRVESRPGLDEAAGVLLVLGHRVWGPA
jgi:hypothetical protein